LSTSCEITFPAIIWPNAKEFDAEFKRRLKEDGLEDIKLMDYAVFYIEGNDIVFSFYDYGESSQYKDIRVSLTDVMKILSTYFGELPAS